jgi:hypothetical protein
MGLFYLSARQRHLTFSKIIYTLTKKTENMGLKNILLYGYPEAGVLTIAIFVGLAIGLIPVIFFCLTLQNTIKEISPDNRRMKPGEVWLALIPLFGIVWQFIIVNRLADSLKAELIQRNIPSTQERPGYSIGLTYCILFCCGIVPVVGTLASLGGLVCWIIYWVQINNYKTQLQQNSSGNGIL